MLFLSSRAEAGAHRPAYEVAIFRRVNGASDRIRVPVRTIMQAGTFGTVPAVSVLAFCSAADAWRRASRWAARSRGSARSSRSRSAAGAASGGPADVTIREGIEGDLGWVSGHTAVATTIAFIASEEPRAVAAGPHRIVGTVGFGRMYVGAISRTTSSAVRGSG